MKSEWNVPVDQLTDISFSIFLLVVGASHYAEGHAELNPMRPYKYVGSAPGYTFNPLTDTGVTLYCHLYGTASPGTHDARLIVYWERMSE